MFLMIILGATDRRAPQGFAPIAIGLGLTLIHLIGIPVTNVSVNPARSTGPAIFVGGWALGQLWLFWRDGREEVLELTAAGFQPTADHNSPLRLNFDAIVDGKALRVHWNDGDDIFYRFFTP